MAQTVAAAVAVFTLATIPAANADDQSFLDELHAAGQPTGPEWVELGHQICDQIHAGASLDQARFNVFDLARNPMGAQSLAAVKTAIAAQRNICPDPRPWFGPRP